MSELSLRLGEGRLETAQDGIMELHESVQKVLDIETLRSTVLAYFKSDSVHEKTRRLNKK